MATQTAPTPAKAERPMPRKFQMRANNECADVGAWTGEVVVFPGDTFFMTLWPDRVRARDGSWAKDADGKYQLTPVKFPTWCDVIDEYPADLPAQPLRKLVPGEASVQGGLNAVRTA